MGTRRIGPEDWPAVAREVAHRLDLAQWASSKTTTPDKARSVSWRVGDAGRLAEAMGPLVPSRWTPELAGRLATHTDVNLAPRRDRPGDMLWENRSALSYKAVRVGHAIAHRDPSGLSRGEMAWLAAEFDGRPVRGDLDLATVAREMLAQEPVTPADAASVTFRHAWRGHRPRSRVTQAVYLGHGAVPIGTVPADRAPVVARLHSPQGPSIELRQVGDVLFRPVLAPGRWEPVRLGEFLAAAADGVAWTDSPFAAPDGDGLIQMGVTDYAGAPPSTSLPSDVAACREARETAMARAGTLVVIDGVVHRSTEPPRLTVEQLDRHLVVNGSIQVGQHITVSLGWRFADGLGMRVQQDTMNRVSDVWCHVDHLAGRYDHGPGEGMSFPVGEGPSVEALVAAWVSDPLAGVWADVTYEPGVPVDVLRPSALPADPDAPFRDLLAWEASFGGPGTTHVADALSLAVDRRSPVELPADMEPAPHDGHDRDVRALLEALVRRANAEIALRADADVVAGMTL